SSRQHLIAFPACNLVVEPGAVGLAGPSTGSSYRDLTGTGWAVGALLQPAAVPHFAADPAALRDTYQPVDLPVLHEPVRRAPAGPGRPAAPAPPPVRCIRGMARRSGSTAEPRGAAGQCDDRGHRLRSDDPDGRGCRRTLAPVRPVVAAARGPVCRVAAVDDDPPAPPTGSGRTPAKRPGHAPRPRSPPAPP